MASCPNKALDAWKVLVKTQGEDTAYYLWDKYDGEVPSEFNTSLDQKLIDGFLKDFNITATEYNDLKEDLGIDSYAASDLVTKAIAYKKGESITSEVAYFAYSMLGKQNNKLRSNLRYLVNKWSKYKERFDYHAKTIKDREGFIKDSNEWKNKIRDLVIIDFLKDNIEDYYKNPKEFKKILDTKWVKGVDKFSSEDYTMWESIVKFFEDLLSSFSDRYRNQSEQLSNLGLGIADEILNKNYEYFDYALGDEQIKKYYNQTIESDQFAKDLVEFSQKVLGLILTGSLALRRAGSVYRTADETLHDIDWVVPYELNSNIENEKVLKNILRYTGPDVTYAAEMAVSFVKDFDWFKKFKEKYPSFQLTNGFYGGEHSSFESLTVQGVIDGEYYTENGFHEEEKSFYTKDPISKKPIKVKELQQVAHKKGDLINNTGYAIDFFVRLEPLQEEHENYFKLWKEIMIAKLKMGRDKDFSDWKAFIPYLKSKDSFNFNYSGFRHLNYESSENNTFEESYDEISETPEATLQKEKVESVSASPKLIKLMKEFIKSIGVDYALVKDIIVDGKKVDANGAALIMQKLIQVVEGKEDVALPEEAMHFAVEIIKQTNPKLYQQLLKEINGHAKLNEVIALYGNDPRYQKDGRRDIVKLKEEAIAQVLADRLEDIVGRTWFERIAEWFKSLIYTKSGFDQASINVLSGKIGSVEDIDVSEGSVYFQLQQGEKVFNDLLETSNRIEAKDGGYELDGVKSARRVSDYAKDFYEKVFPPSARSEFEDAVNSLKAEKGTAGHSDIEYAYKILVDPTTGLLREEMLDDSDYVSKLNPNDRRMYNALRDNLQERLLSFPEGTRFMSEVKIFDKKRKIGGTVDFIAITPDGKTSILDWKFMDLNTDAYEDIPWYKVEAWRIQMGLYKGIIATNYGVKSQDFAQTRMIPILAKYTKADFENEILPRLLEIKIGSADVQKIEEDYLLPVGITDEISGKGKKIDKLIEQFNATYRKLAEEKVNESERANKNEQLNALYKAIRHLQIKGNVVPLINQAKILNKQVSMLLKRYKADFEGQDPSEIDGDKINAFAGMIRVHLEALQPYLNLKQLGSLLEDETEENEKLKLELSATRDKVENYISDLQDLDGTFGEKFNNTSSTPEKVVKGITKWFSSVATIQVANIQTLYKLANKAFGLANIETLEQVKKLNSISDRYNKWASARGLSKGNYFSLLMKKDKNELIDEFDKKFYDDLKSKIGKKDFAWILDNVDQDAYKEHIEALKEEEIQRVLSRPKVGTLEEVEAQVKREFAKIYTKYDLQDSQSNGWLIYKELKQFPKKDKWESEEWKTLNKPENAPAKEFYDYIVERNNYFQSIGYLNGKAARKFLPWVRQGFTEGLIFDGKSRGILDQFLRDISMDESEAGYGQTDPVTGELINSVPKYFTSDFGEGYSTDLFKTMALYNEYAIKFKNLKDIEERSLQLLRVERNKKSIMTSLFGKLLKEGDDSLKFNPNNLENSKLLEDMVKSIIYQQKYIQSEVFDLALGKISGFGKNINDKLGMKIFPEDLSGRQISANKVLDTLNSQFQMVTLGLNPLSAFSNFFGGTVQGLINAGKYFTKLDYLKTQMWMLTSKMTGGEDRQKALAALDYFVPFVENYNKHASRKLSLNKIDEQAVQDYLMVLMRNGDEAIQALNAYTFLKNAIVEDGKIVNVREYLRGTDEYKAFYSGTQQERKARADKFETDVKELLDSKGVLKLGQVVDGEFVIPGVDKKSDSVIEFRRLIQSFTTDALGSMSEENKRIVNMNVYTSSMMVFKNWIPRLVDVRIGDIKYNAASDAYEWGRMRMIFGMLTKDLLKSISSLTSAIGGNDDVWLNQVRELYDKKQADYEANTGKKLKMTEDEFIALVNQNVKNQALDVVILLTLISLVAALKAMAPDDDEDVIVRNQYKFLLKATDKLTDEIMYFYNPTTPLDLISGKGGILPSIGLLKTYGNFWKNFVSENYGIIVDDQEIRDDATPIKYFMKSFPISNQAAGLLPMFYPELAKDLEIKMQSQYGIR